MNQAKISVIIPCHNSELWLSETLRSLQSQENISEIIIVDDDCRDNSLAVANSYSCILPIKVIPNVGRGVSNARNTGIAHSSGEWIQFIDADDILMPHKIARHLHLGISRQADVVYGSWQTYQEIEDKVFTPQCIKTPDYSGDLMLRILQSDNFCQIGAMLFRPQLLHKIGGFREDMNLGGEDVNLYLRLALSNANFVKDESEKVCLLYRRQRGSSSMSTRDPLAFYCGVLKNITLVEDAWSKEALSTQRKDFLLQVYGNVARFYFESDRRKFYEVLAKIHTLDPHYLPNGPQSLRRLSKWLGYERAEVIALAYRRLKILLAN